MLSKLFISFFAVAMISTGAVAQEQTTPETPAPAEVPKEENILYLDLSTGGRVAIQLYPALAPNHVERIKTLTRQGFYDGVIFHRVIEGFMAQTGDPTGTGMGGSELPDLKAEFHAYPHLRGVVSMARAQGEDSANSQFFIVFYPRFALDKKYTVFGRVTDGMQYVDAINRGEPPANPSRILQASIAADGKAPPAPRSVGVLSEAGVSDDKITVDDLNAPIEQ
ncbi:peptidylprolyl isomerase [Parasphingorhabdus sp. JC815]|uniref:peptidylprolyl isomerase n=1 Tax=Parasphingorhabdus sp. JC815 TaxID=3232140 RepID=UPI003459E528